MGLSTAALLFHPGKQPELSILGTQHSPLRRWKFLKQHAMGEEHWDHVIIHNEAAIPVRCSWQLEHGKTPVS
jgi:hypothetical protein